MAQLFRVLRRLRSERDNVDQQEGHATGKFLTKCALADLDRDVGCATIQLEMLL